MDHSEFREKAKEMVDFIADYLENIRDRRVFPSVQPGYLHTRLPTEAPQEPEEWDQIFKDVEEHIMPGVTHWQSPHMHAYFPCLNSYPAILGDMLSSGLNMLCFTWASSPAGTELETISMNWLGKAIGLPDAFLNEGDDSLGGGVIQTTGSEATLCSLLAARTKTLAELSKLNPEMESAELLGHLVCYCSDQAHSSVEKAGIIGMVRMRYIESDENQSMRGAKLEEAILIDKAKGMVPFWVCATLGTTGTVAFDNLREIGEVCEKHSAWLHVDAAYAGSAFICPEFRHWLDGIELVDSFAFNPSKWLMVNFDCTAMWVKDSSALHRTFNVNPIYLRHENSGKAIDYMDGQRKKPKRRRRIITKDYFINGNKPIKNGIKTRGDTKIAENDNQLQYDDEEDDNEVNGYETIASRCGKKMSIEDSSKKEFLHWQIPLSRRFRALKLWFVLRNYGISGLQKHIRENIRLAQKFEALVLADPRFHIPQARHLGTVVFRLKGDNMLTERMLKRLNSRGFVHCVPAHFKDIYVIRFVVTSPRTNNQDILDDWTEMKTVADEILNEEFGSVKGNVHPKTKVSLKDTRNATFGTSLLLANSPMSPKIVNGTHMAICDYEHVLSACAHRFAQLKLEPKDSPEMRRRIRGIKSAGKGLSLDSCMDMVQGMVMETRALPLCSEEKEEAASAGSSPGDRSTFSLSPTSSSTIIKSDLSSEPANQLQIPSPRHRSKSIDVSGFMGLDLTNAKVSINRIVNEIVITPTGSKTFTDDMKNPNMDVLETTEPKVKLGTRISQALENLQDGLQMLSEFRTNDKEDKVVEEDIPTDVSDSKLTIRGPSSYIKRIIQQFSEGPSEEDDAKPEADRQMQTIKNRADALCKKCLHFKGKISK